MKPGMSGIGRPLFTILVTLGVALVVIGYFSPWVSHPAAGLALTGFEIAEWIKFAPEVQAGTIPFRRAWFYWPPAVASLGLAALAAGLRRGWLLSWLLALLGASLAILPLPLLEEIGGIDGIRANLGRLELVALGFLAAALAALYRHLPTRLWGASLLGAAAAGLCLTSVAFAGAEPLVEGLLRQTIDPGLGFQLTRGGLVLLAAAAVLLLLGREAKRRCSS